MHFVIHTQYYPPEIGAPQARLSFLASALVKRGHHVTVLTAMPNYPRGVIHTGYAGWMKAEDLDDVHILRAWIYPTNSLSFVPRLFNYFSFVFSSFFVGLIYLDAPDIILTESPPLFLGISGYLLSRLKRARWFFNVSDLWPESAVRLGVVQNAFLLRIGYWLEAFCYRKAWCVGGQSREILESIGSRFPNVQTYYLSNGTDTNFFASGGSTRSRKAGVMAVYAGLHGLAQGLDQLLYAADQLRDLSGFKMLMVGDGPLKTQLKAQASELKLDNVHFLDPLPRSEMPKLLADANFCLVLLGRELPGAVPSKLYEAMSAGRAVLLMACGEAAEIVKRHDSGLVVFPGDVDSLANALRRLALDRELRERLGANGRRAAREYYDHSAIVEKFAAFLESE